MSGVAKKGIQSVDVAFSIMDCVESAGEAVALKDISNMTGLSTSKVHNYLVSLVRIGLLQSGARHGSYDLGEKALSLGLSALRRVDVLKITREAMIEVRNLTGLTCFMTVWGNYGPTIVNWIESKKPVTVEIRPGSVLPLLTSATGQVFHAFLPEAMTEDIANEEKANLNEDVLKKLNIEANINNARHNGLAMIDGLLSPSIIGISAPIIDHDNRIRAALTLINSRNIKVGACYDAEVKILLDITKNVTRRLGFSEAR